MTTETVTPRNRGLLARDLTEAAHRCWQRGMRLDVYTMPEEVRAAENVIVRRIGDLEDENERLKKRLKRIAEWYEALGAAFQKLGEQEQFP